MRTRTLALLLAAGALGGCAVIPGTESSIPDVESTDAIHVMSTNTVQASAACVQRNVETSIPSWFVASTTPRDAALRVHLRSAVGTAALVDVVPAAAGSALNVRISRHYLARALLTEKITLGC